jgi:hypothetical protein
MTTIQEQIQDEIYKTIGKYEAIYIRCPMCDDECFLERKKFDKHCNSNSHQVKEDKYFKIKDSETKSKEDKKFLKERERLMQKEQDKINIINNIKKKYKRKSF